MDFLSSKEITVPDFQGKKILFCVLNWGIGHATRSIPIIKKLASKNEIFLASDGEALSMLSEIFPEYKMTELQSYNVHYSKNRNFTSHLFRQLPKVWKAIQQEHTQIKKVVESNDIDIIVSDNRYGCHSRQCQNYIITHQLSITSPYYLANKIFEKTANYFLRNFNEVWIPDDEYIQLSGELSSRQLNLTKRYLGFNNSAPAINLYKEKFILFLISGPEPRRSLIISKIMDMHQSIEMKKVFIQGKWNSSQEYNTISDIEIFSSMSHNKTLEFISAAEIIVCRSGYSTLIDLYNLKKEKVICIPTLGQPEQEYLAKYWSEKGWINTISEEEVDSKLVQRIKRML